jgi:hypothetical protein
MGKWIKKEPPPHVCDTPVEIPMRDNIRIGSVWQCACGWKWKLTDIQYYDSDTMIAVDWERVL